VNGHLGPEQPNPLQHPFFDGFGAADLAVIERIAMPLEYAPGEILFEQGAPADAVLFLLCGRVRVGARLPGGSEVVLAEVPAGHVLGELGLLAGHRRSATARALSPVSALAIDCADLLALCANYHPASLRLLERLSRLVAGRLRDTRTEAALLLDADPGPSDAGDRRMLRPCADFDFRRFLPQLAFFAGYTAGDIAAFCDCAEVLSAPRGSVLCRHDGSCDSLFVVIRGAVQTTLFDDRRLFRTGLFGPGQAFGEVEWLLGASPGPGAASWSHATVLRLAKAGCAHLGSPTSRLAFRFQGSLLRGLLCKLDVQARDYTRSRLVRMIER
jgi:CRP/FNR family cyclic AMP-dependent transcriptional regulator